MKIQSPGCIKRGFFVYEGEINRRYDAKTEERAKTEEGTLSHEDIQTQVAKQREKRSSLTSPLSFEHASEGDQKPSWFGHTVFFDFLFVIS